MCLGVIMAIINRSGVNRNQKSTTSIIPSPVGGWNSKDSTANLNPKYAKKLVNWFATTSDLGVRKGFIPWASGVVGQVNSLMPYTGTSRKIYASSGDSIYDVTNNAVVGVAEVTGLNNDKFIYANITTAGSSFLIAVNGVDAPQLYNGISWQSVTDVSTPIAITGVTTTNLSYVTLAKRRLWFVERDTTKAWYLPVNQVGGVAVDFDLGAVFVKGGYLKAISSWSITGGFGVQDLTAFISTEGDIAVFQGDDPDDATTWKLVGVYNLGSPVGNMPFARLGTDLLVLTQRGLTSLSQGQFFADISSSSKISLTDNIQPDINRSTTLYYGNHGWQVIAYPNENMLLINIPVQNGGQIQYAMNTITGAWHEFNQIYANCFLLFDEIMYFGGAGGTFQFWQTYTDNTAQVNAQAITAFSTFRTSRKKLFKMVRPTISTHKSNQISLGMELDYKIANNLSTPTIPNDSEGIWDEGEWDNVVWAGDELNAIWANVQGIGFAGALNIKVACRDAFRWASTEYMYEVGSIF
jgi:hypothetical protein